MNRHGLQTVCVELTGEQLADKAHMDRFQQLMDDFHDSINEYIQDLSEELGVSYGCAADIYYLRTRSRWTEELENKLIQLHKQGNPPNMSEFGN